MIPSSYLIPADPHHRYTGSIPAAEMAMPARTEPQAKPTFSRETFGFLRELTANNQRVWFEANKPRYEAVVLEPALAFVERMGPRLDKISKHFLAIPKRSGGSLMRIYRDTRFSRDKAPYKTNIGIQFRHEQGRDIHAPGFYVHIEPDGCFLGAGLWHPEPAALHSIRTAIVEDPDAWRKAVSAKGFRNHFELAGERLSRPPRGFPATAPYIEDLKFKDFIGISALGNAEVLTPGLDADVATRFRAAARLVAFLCAALSLPF
jgi:uncharacterized protein (TIGR02453 family)